MMRKIILALLCVIIVISICILSHIAIYAYISYVSTEAKFNNPNKKLWHHASNDTINLNTYLHEFGGVEFDVNFDSSLHNFDIRHDYDGVKSGITLDKYFGSIDTPTKYHYWIDFKNLSVENADSCGLKISELCDKYKIRDNLFVESQSAESLGMLSKYNINTSYWIPQFDYSFLNIAHQYYAYTKITFQISKDIRRYGIDAISSNYLMVPHLQNYFPKMNVHIWTNGLLFKKDSLILMEYYKNKNIKVILVDDKDDWAKRY